MAAYLREVPSGQFRVGHREFEVDPKGGRLPPDSKLELRRVKVLDKAISTNKNNVLCLFSCKVGSLYCLYLYWMLNID